MTAIYPLTARLRIRVENLGYGSQDVRCPRLTARSQNLLTARIQEHHGGCRFDIPGSREVQMIIGVYFDDLDAIDSCDEILDHMAQCSPCSTTRLTEGTGELHDRCCCSEGRVCGQRSHHEDA